MCEAVKIAYPVSRLATAVLLVAAVLFGSLVPPAGAAQGGSAKVRQAAAQPSDTRTRAQGDNPAEAPATEPSSEQSPARVYLFRGALGLIFSRGMDKLAARIQRTGVTVNVYEFTLCGLIASAAIEEYKQNPFPIILMGHSMGGRCALEFSEKLKDEGIPVDLVVTIDPAHLSPSVPTNVARFINIFLSKDVLGGGDIQPVSGFAGHYASYDLQNHGELHINIDKMDVLHQQLAAKVLEVAAAGAKSEGASLPLRFVVPAKADVELWDSGMAVAARSGDTLQSLAAQYRLPVWALAQLNQLAESSPLGAGQRVIVPRHVAMPPVVAEPVSSKR